MRDISLVFQGPVQEVTARCISAARRILPSAEIIVSTWSGSDVSGLDADRVLLTNDPGPTILRDLWGSPKVTNLGRQILSTVNGIRAASMPFTAKIRTDTEITGEGFLRALEGAGSCPSKGKLQIFDQKIVAPEFYMRNPRRYPALFHPSDIFLCGRTLDLLKMFNVPPQPEFSPLIGLTDGGGSYRYAMVGTPETYIWMNAMHQARPELNLNAARKFRFVYARISENSLLDNFQLQTMSKLGLRMHVREKFFSEYPDTCYKVDEWSRLEWIRREAPFRYRLELFLKTHWMFWQPAVFGKSITASLRVCAGKMRRDLAGAGESTQF